MPKHNSFHPSQIKGRTVHLKDGDDVNKALRKLKKKVEESKILEEVRKREYYEKPTTKRKRAQAAAKARYRKKIEKEQLPKKNW